jgi:Endonuclease V
MKLAQNHHWPVTVEEAIALQQTLRQQVITTDQLGTIQYVAGVDAAYQETDGMTKAAVAVLSFPDLQLRETAIAICPTTFPYKPGFPISSFRKTDNSPRFNPLRRTRNCPSPSVWFSLPSGSFNRYSHDWSRKNYTNWSTC